MMYSESLLNRVVTKESVVLHSVEYAIRNKQCLLLTYFNQHSFNIAFSDPNYRDLLNDKFLLYTDGIGLYLTSKFLLHKKPELFNATDLNNKLVEEFEKRSIKYFFIGGNFKLENIAVQMKGKTSFSGYNPGYHISYVALKEKIFEVNPHVIMIGMGIPLQEKLAYDLSYDFNDKIFICVGNFFEFHFQHQKRLPKILRNKGIEWIFRLTLEPKRLWKRYIIGIPVFIFRIIKIKLSSNL